jgi:4-diphosphocytidyl-2-C-methyl-D-erythritol kinase
MNALYDLAAPAKLNLFLHIVGRRPDGYHLLQSAFALIDWADRLHVERRTDGLIERMDIDEHDQAFGEQDPASSMQLPAEDLCIKAAKLLQGATGCSLGARIYLHKRLPSQAGLGGGSSDAATTLLALNRLWGTGLGRQDLQRLGLQLGADVPFFLSGGHAWVEGIGEIMSPLALPPRSFAVLKPATGLSTPAIFSDPALKRDTKPATISGFTANSDDFGQNDLQPVAERLCPDVGLALEQLQSWGLKPRMTGSGSAVFAVCPDDFLLPNPMALPSGWTQKICQTLAAHPLVDW